MSASTERYANRNVPSRHTDVTTRTASLCCCCRYLTQLEMQLQLRCEDVEADIESTAHHLTQQMPSMLQATDKIQVLPTTEMCS